MFKNDPIPIMEGMPDDGSRMIPIYTAFMYQGDDTIWQQHFTQFVTNDETWRMVYHPSIFGIDKDEFEQDTADERFHIVLIQKMPDAKLNGPYVLIRDTVNNECILKHPAVFDTDAKFVEIKKGFAKGIYRATITDATVELGERLDKKIGELHAVKPFRVVKDE